MTGHAYTSTACHHGLHDRCRRTCKFCGVGCGCECHDSQAVLRSAEAPLMRGLQSLGSNRARAAVANLLRRAK